MNSAAVPAPSLPLPAALPVWRLRGVVAGAMLGLFAGFNGLFFGTLPFFMRPIGAEFGWGRAQVSLAAVLSMLGVSLASPLVGRLIDRYGAARTIGGSVLLLSASLLALGHMPPSLPLYAALSLAVGVGGAATTMAGYIAVLPRWFDRRLGLALGVAGVGLGLGVILNGWLATALIGRLGWREAYGVLAAFALVVGAIGLALLAPRGANAEAERTAARDARASADAATGLNLRAALRTPGFWLLAITTLLVPMAILGSAVHAPSLYADRGMTPQQAALGASLAGLGAMAARIGVGALLDRYFAPRLAMVVFGIGAAGLFLGSTATSLTGLVLGSLLQGIAIGAEGDLVPYLVRRYFGLRAFGAVFGSLFAAYALGGVLGPALYGLAFDIDGGYARVMQAGAVGCLLCALLLVPLGRYPYATAPRVESA